MATEGDVSEALEAIVLAGGAGARFGGGKLLAPWAGGVLLDGALACAFAAPVRSVVVVSGADRRVEAASRDHARRAGHEGRLRLVHAADHASGMAASLRTGVAALPPDTTGVFVFLGDMPKVPPSILPRLAQAVGDGALAAAPVFQGRRGHPVLFGRDLLRALLTLDGDEGARTILSDLGDGLVLTPTEDEGVLFDVDRPDDLATRTIMSR